MKTMQAELSNPKHSEYGVATIPFPIPDEEYDHVLELLEPLEIGDYVERDCQVDRLIGVPPILHRLEQTLVNLDELDFLIQRLDSFDYYEMEQFQALAYAYLVKHRKIDRDIISTFAKEKLIYEDSEYHNAVFVGLDENGVPRHAHKRSVNSFGSTTVSKRGNIGRRKRRRLPQHCLHHKTE